MNVRDSFARRSMVACGCLLTLVSWYVWAAPPRLVRDINPHWQPISSMPTDFFDLGADSFFTANDGVSGHEPWTTDGTAEGTFMWGDVAAGIAGTTGRVPVRAGGLTYIVQNEGFTPPTLWLSNGTPQGTRRLNVSGWATNVANAEALGALGNLVALSVFNTANSARELWVSDGTDAGTRRVPSANAEVYSISAHVIAGSRLFFLSLDQDHFDPWVSDGTSQGTYRLIDIPDVAPGSTFELIRLGDFILFTAATTTSGHELWRIDTRDLSVSQVTDTAPGSASALRDNTRMGRVGNVVVFAASPAGDTDMNLWRSDGTAAGTFQISDVDVLLNSFPAYFGSGERVLFRALGPNGVQLWGTDGTSSGTQLLRDEDAFNDRMFQVADRFYFGDPGDPTRLWSTDGTSAGTRALSGIIPANERVLDVAGTSSTLYVRTVGQRLPPPNNHINGPGRLYRYDHASATTTPLIRYELENSASTFHLLRYAQGRLYFDNLRPDTGRELWVSDGTVNGTRLLKNLAPEVRTFDSSPAGLVRLRDKVFFTADDGTLGREVWYSDGTEAGTQVLVDAVPGETGSEPSDLFVARNELYFYARDAAATYRLWRSDGSAAGTQPLATLKPRPSSLREAGCDSRGVALPNGNILFAGFDDTFGLQLWSTDGTTAGTVRLTNLAQVNGGPRLCHLTVVDDQVYFHAYDSAGRELWKSNGTAAGTQLVVDLNPQGAGADPRSLIQWNDSLYFIANDAQGAHLWTTDGTASGTRIATEFDGGVPLAIAGIVASRLLLSVRESSQFTLPWALAEGSVTRLAAPTLVSIDGVPSVHNGMAFFSGHSTGPALSDIEPWVTDGTLAGTRQVFDTHPGLLSYPTAFTDFHGITLFETNAFTVGLRQWRTDGTEAGTRTIGEFSLGAERVAANQRLFYVASDAAAGIELFAIDNEQPSAGDDDLGSVQAGQSISGDLLANDTDGDGALDAGSISIVAAPAGGSVTLSVNGQIVYAARAGFSGADSFTYSVADDQGYASNVATVRVTVTASPTPPSNPPPASGGGSGGGGGGGSLLFVDLFVLGLFAALSRRRARVSSTA